MLAEAVRESEFVENPLNTAVSVSTLVIDYEKELISKDGGEDLCAVVVHTAVPHMMVQVEAGFQPIVEWFNFAATPSQESLGKWRDHEGLARFSEESVTLAFASCFPAMLCFAKSAMDMWAHKPPDGRAIIP